MRRLSSFAVTAVYLLTVVFTAFADGADGEAKAQQKLDVERVNAASQAFVAAIAARDIQAMDEVWAHEPYTTFIGPLSTNVVFGWDGVRKAWEMRFGQFDRVTISLAESHIHTNGKIAWAVGIEKVQLLRKDGKTLNFDTFTTNVFEERNGHWLMVSHQATPMFRESK
jgi:ketosteroid isomerase-like protein